MIFSGLQILFVISFFLRVLTIGFFVNKLRALRVKEKIKKKEMIFKTLVVFPFLDTIHGINHIFNLAQR